MRGGQTTAGAHAEAPITRTDRCAKEASRFRPLFGGQKAPALEKRANGFALLSSPANPALPGARQANFIAVLLGKHIRQPVDLAQNRLAMNGGCILAMRSPVAHFLLHEMKLAFPGEFEQRRIVHYGKIRDLLK